VLKNTIDKLAGLGAGGSTFSDALALHPKIFTICTSIWSKRARSAGVLELVLTRLSEFQEKSSERLRTR